MTIYAIDFDGTCVEHEYPWVGADVPGAADTLQQLVSEGHQLILWTMRSGETLDAAVQWFSDRNIPILGANVNPEQASWTSSPKAYAHVYIDDAALGCPLVQPAADDTLARPYVDWTAVRVLLDIDSAIA